MYWKVLANLVMEELLPSLEKEMLPRLKAKKTERKRVWFAVSHTSLKSCSQSVFKTDDAAVSVWMQIGVFLTFYVTGSQIQPS